MDLVDCFAFAGGVEEGRPGCVDFGKEGLEEFGGTWTRVETCTGCDRGVPFSDSCVGEISWIYVLFRGKALLTMFDIDWDTERHGQRLGCL